MKCNNENNIGERNKYWISDEVRPYIFEFLKKEFPNMYILHEFDQVDLFVLDENLPVEIQSVRLQTKGKDILKGPCISNFEDNIRRQIESNISIYGRCWFFFDAHLLEYMQNDMGRHNSINLDWLYQYMKEGKMRIFVITFDGIIKEMCDEDFIFLTKFSATCKRSENEDFRILRKNRSKIILNVLKGHRFTMEEVNNIYNLFKFKGDDGQYKSLLTWLMRKEQGRTNRQLEYGYIRDIRLEHINNVLNCMIDNGAKDDSKQPRNSRSLLYMLLSSGLFDKGNDRIYFVDKYDIAQYLPGYIRNIELWNYLKTHSIENRLFLMVIRGEYPNYLEDRKKQNNMFDYEDKGDIVKESEQTEYKGVNVTIESKDQIITVNIKDKTKQGNIEDSWF